MTGTGTNPIRDPFAEALFPVLIHRMNNATQILSTLGAVLVADLDDELLEGCSEDLASASRDVRELGWLMGVLASAGGADLLLDRREESGLAVVLQAVREALRRQGRDLADPAPDEPLPALAADAGDGWQVPWAIGSVLWTAGGLQSPRGTLVWRLEPAHDPGAPVAPRERGWHLRCTLPANAPETWTALARRIAAELRGASLSLQGDTLELVLPAGSLHARTRSS